MRAVVVPFVALAVVLGACGAVLDIPSEVTERRGDASTPTIDTGTDAPAQCPASAEVDVCFKCTDEACCNEYATCKADPRCGAYYKECLPSCKAAGKTYDQCVVECDGTNGAGHATFLPYFACGEVHCLAECSNGKPDVCTQCLYASCRDPVDACARDRQCDTLRACVNICTPLAGSAYQSCVTACSAKASPQAQDAFNRLTTCSIQFCGQTCS